MGTWVRVGGSEVVVEVGGVREVGETFWQEERPAKVNTMSITKKFFGCRVDIWMIIPELKNQGAAHAAP